MLSPPLFLGGCGMKHSFDIEVAKELGVNCAVLLENLYFWVEKNRANGKHFHEGTYWTYNSAKAFVELFPYMTERGITYALTKLEEQGYILTGNFNPVAYDRTKWYALTKRGYSILQNCQMEITKLQNGIDKIVEPIPDINQIEKPDNKQEDVEQGSTLPYSEIIEYLNRQVGSSFRSSSKENQKCIKARLQEGFSVQDFKRVIDIKVKEWKHDKKMAPYLRPITLFSPKFESYLNQTTGEDPVSIPSKDEGVAVDENGKPIVF